MRPRKYIAVQISSSFTGIAFGCRHGIAAGAWWLAGDDGVAKLIGRLQDIFQTYEPDAMLVDPPSRRSGRGQGTPLGDRRAIAIGTAYLHGASLIELKPSITAAALCGTKKATGVDKLETFRSRGILIDQVATAEALAMLHAQFGIDEAQGR